MTGLTRLWFTTLDDFFWCHVTLKKCLCFSSSDFRPTVVAVFRFPRSSSFDVVVLFGGGMQRKSALWSRGLIIYDTYTGFDIFLYSMSKINGNVLIILLLFLMYVSQRMNACIRSTIMFHSGATRTVLLLCSYIRIEDARKFLKIKRIWWE